MTEIRRGHLDSAPTVVDLFCGCGGMSWGLQQEGFKIIAGVDNNRAALKTYRVNFPTAQALEWDLSRPMVQLRDQLELEEGRLDVLVGGPPCQGFSKNVPRGDRFLEDAKNLLVRSYMEAIEVFRPKALVMENVAEMANAFDGAFRDELLSHLDRLGYAADYHVHNAAEFGVPQRRRRVVFLANRMGTSVRFPARRYRVPLKEGTHKSAVQGAEGVTVWEAIGDLAPVRGRGGNPNSYSRTPFSEFQRLMRAKEAPLTQHEERRLRPQQQARYEALEAGQGLKDLPDHLRPKSGYSGAYGRLTQDMIAPTITRWVFHPGSGRFGHPVESRIITIREAARFQSFSDDFKFEGTNQEKSWQIGNAVPPLLMRCFAPILRDFVAGVAGPQSRQAATQQLSLL